MKSFFIPVGDGYKYITSKYQELPLYYGNVVQDTDCRGIFAEVVLQSGDGHYVEIGSLYGGSAIVAALVKEHFGLDGMVYCVDPTPRHITENAKQYGVDDRIIVVNEVSSPWLLGDTGFSMGYIDGDHRPPHPTEDWNILKEVVTRYILFDDYDRSEVGVTQGIRHALIEMN